MMPIKGKVYTTSTGQISQQFDGTSYRIVDVRVNVGAGSTVQVTVQ
ncbi:MAG: hypothetical protein MUC50_24185 [Myxococcota bacterium]|nr:hypothetical protein [Myxococcota bacterium]